MIRLAGIEAPKKGQPVGDRSKESLSRLVLAN
jgi:endonuclease YncB( thermonuclease family)